MAGKFGGGLDKGKERVKMIGFLMITAFVLWFLYEGLQVIANFQQ